MPNDIFSPEQDNWELVVAQGNYPGVTGTNKFGSNPAVGTSEEDLWDGGGLYPGFLMAADTVRIAAGGNAADDAAGLGARSIRVFGIDNNFKLAQEDIVTAGASASSSTTTQFWRVYRAFVLTSGAYGAPNTGDIVIETTGGTTVAQITATLSQTEMCIFSTPVTKAGYLCRYSGEIDGTKTATIHVNMRENFDNVVAPFAPKRVLQLLSGISGPFEKVLKAYTHVPPKSDVWISAIGPSGSAAISSQFDMYLVNV